MAADAQQTRSPGRQVLRACVSIVVVAAIFGFAIPRLNHADYRQAWHEMGKLSVSQVAWLNVANMWNVVSYWFMLVIALPGLTWGQAMVVNNGSTAVSNVMPGGGALGIAVTWRMLQSWGFRAAAISRQIVIVGVWNNIAKLALPVIAWAILLLGGGSSAPLVSAAITGLVALAIAVALCWAVLASDDFARRIGRWLMAAVNTVRRRLDRAPVTNWDDAVSQYRSDMIDTVRKRGAVMTLAVIVDHLALYIVLLLAIRVVGISNTAVSWQECFAAFSTLRLATAIPITPGGLGFVEAGYVSVLAKMSGDASAAMSSRILAAVLIFRLITYVTPIILGGLCLGYWSVTSRWRVDRTDPPPAQAAA